jgi:ribonuclease D
MNIKPQPVLVTDPEQLELLATGLSAAPIVAVDTESNSLYAYRERVCLIQFSIPSRDYLVDSIVLEDLSPLGPIFANPDIEKVFHAAEYDLICLKRDFGFEFANLFDTMIAARILGRKAVGLGSLLEEEFDIHLEKRFQRANWGKRPLSPDMLSYARLDTHYLIRLRERLKVELETSGRWPIAEEDFIRICDVNGCVPAPQETNIWRMNGVRDLAPQQNAVLQELVNYRQQRAEALDQPLFKVLGDKTLVALASAMPGTIAELSRVPGMTEKQINRHGKQLFAALKRGLKAERLYPPRKPRYDEGFIERLDALRDWRKKSARNMGVESDVVMPRILLEEIARKNPVGLDELAQLLRTAPWRLQRYGEEILQVLADQ